MLKRSRSRAYRDKADPANQAPHFPREGEDVVLGTGAQDPSSAFGRPR
jgi:hypothetical protein